MTRCLFIVLATVCVLGPGIAAAQSADPPEKPQIAAKPVARDGQEIRVTMRTGERRTGRFVGLTSSELVMRWGQNRDVILLREVRRIETVSHHARTGALLGGFAGFFWAAGICSTDENSCTGDSTFSLTATVLVGFGAGIGAAIGGILNAATADRHVLYENRSGPVATVIPILGGGKTGVGVTLRW
jgi:hypothetical protein